MVILSQFWPIPLLIIARETTLKIDNWEMLGHLTIKFAKITRWCAIIRSTHQIISMVRITPSLFLLKNSVFGVLPKNKILAKVFPEMNLINLVWTRRPKFKAKSYNWVHRILAAFLNRKFRLSKIHSKLRSLQKFYPLTAYKTSCWIKGELQVKIYLAMVDKELESQRIQVKLWLQTALNSDIRTSS